MVCQQAFPATCNPRGRAFFLLLLHYCSAVLTLVSAQEPSARWPTLSGKPPLVIARGGFSGLFPDSSSIAYDLARAVSLPNVHLWCDVQLTKDGAGICAPSVKLENATDIATIYKNRSRVYQVNKVPTRGWFSLDFTYKELANNVSLNQGVYSRTNRFDSHGFAIITVDHLAKTIKPPGLWLNVQYDAFFTQHNLSMTRFVLSVSRRVKVDYISSPEVAFLTRIASGFQPTTTKLVFRFLGRDEIEPSTSQTYGSLLKNLTFVKTFASGILVPKDYIWPVDATLYLQPRTSVVADAHKAGLEVFASDFVNDVPLSYNYSHDPISEYLSFVNNADFSVDGVLSDFPITPSEAIACFAHLGRRASSQAKPLIISKYGASGDYPGCTDLAYEKAIADGAEVIDCPVQLAKDGTPFCLSSENLTESAIVDPKAVAGIFSFNLAWNQIQTLKPAIANPSAKYKMFRNPKSQNAGKFVTLSDFLALSKNAKSLTGVLINIENAQGVSVADAVNEALIKAGFDTQTSLKVMIQSSNSSVLMKFKGKSNKYELVYKADGNIVDGPDADSAIKNIKTFADSVVVSKDFIFPELEAFITNTTDIVPKLQAEKLSVYVETFSNEFVTQSWDFLSDATVEINTFVQVAKVDGIITDFPNTAARYKRNLCLGVGKKTPSYMEPVKPGSLYEFGGHP
ncbi:glycerophosphodiester phosphodiesterase GDPDL3-like [Juglans microcarpa x Juglans regia]|uniref:glycerophosphodiester phosphodiesterase GDPDL3-like n=1 Tax=Juglans microcarpa x Juglans regia TaxID=2249226 RepID=UPI001B7E50F6|nr:glycerophosphodiester phosphodiesterase GDPDL3-like [Juglans microcarpa x Juglans regia]